jgi:hypothetical protein
MKWRRNISIAVLALVCGAPQARAVTETCREWLREHDEWKARALGRVLAGAPARAVDEAVFELVQREAYLTSCPARVDAQRPRMIGWRLVGRSPDAYADAVVESVLEEAGFTLDLRSRFAPLLRSARRER